MKTHLKPVAAAVALALLSGPAVATEFWLCAKETTLTMPDGTVVPMWGYAKGVDATDFAAGCTANAPQIPGPTLVNDGALTIHLRNDLPAGNPTSIVIPGQALPDGSLPTWVNGLGEASNARTAPDSGQRVRSFGTEVVPGATADYAWSALTGNGTLMYHSGTHPQKQVYMGLAGLVTNDAVAGSEVHPGATYANSVELFFSDIDPAFNEAVVSPDGLATAIDRHPTWFLINGAPYEAGVTDDIDTGTVIVIDPGTGMPIPTPRDLHTGEATLLRLASTATNTHVAVLQGMNMTIHGEDGFQYNWQDPGAGTTTPAPREQYSAMLPSAKTKDAILTVPVPTPSTDSVRFAVYDGNGYMSNPSDSGDTKYGDTVGGMLRFLSFAPSGANTPPVANDDPYSTNVDVALVVGPPGVLGNDTDADPADTLAVSEVNGDPAKLGVPTETTALGSVTLLANGSFDYTPPAGVPAADSFTYTVADGNGGTDTATVTIDVTVPNEIPVAYPDSVTTEEDVAVTFVLTGSDADLGDTLTFSVVTDPANGTLDTTLLPTVTYTPNDNYNGSDSFTFVANDGKVDSTPATVDITVSPVNDAPVVDPVADQVGTNGDVVSGLQIVASDPDVGDTLAYSATNLPLDLTIDSGTGLISGTIAADASTTSPYLVQVDVTDLSAATTSVTFLWTVNAVPATTTSLYFSTLGAGSVPGVAGPYDDADVYSVDSANAFARVYDAVSDMGLPNNANIDGMSIVGDTIYLSFAGSNTSVPGLGNVPDEDVVAWDSVSGTWSPYFDGSVCGLDSSNGQDVDAISVSGGTLYFSILSGGSRNPVAGGPGHAATIYQYNVTTGCTVARSAGTDLQTANVDGLTVVGGAGGTYYMSFDGAINLTGVGAVQDEDVVQYSGGTWSLYFDGAGTLDATDAQDIDALDVPPQP